MPAALRPREALYVDRASAATARSGSKCGRGLAANSSIADLLKSPAKRLHRQSTVTPQWSGIAAPLVRSRNDRAAPQMSKRIAHFPLDIVRKQSVSGGQWRAEVRSFQMETPSSSPPPAPVGLRGVAVVRRDGAPRPREELT